MDEERLIILRRIESGDITIEDGMKILDAIEGRTYAEEDGQAVEVELPNGSNEQTGETGTEVLESQETAPPVDLRDPRWKVWSWVVFGLFVLLTALSSVWIAQGWAAHPWGWGFWLAWFPFLIGVLGMITTYNARWLHVRIQQAPGEKPRQIAVSLPLPLGLISLIVPLFSRWMPAEVNGQNLGELLHEMDQSLSGNEPIHIFVNDKDGSKVEVYIG